MEKVKNSNRLSSFKIFGVNPEPIALITLPIEKHLKYKNEIQLIFEKSPENLNQKFPLEPYSEHICNAINQNIFNSFPQLIELRSDINSYILDFIAEIGFLCEEIIISSAWANKANKNSTLDFHQHANSYISGNYFVNFDDKNHRQLLFQNDRKLCTSYRQVMTITNIKGKSTSYNQDAYVIPAKEGQILLWRSHLAHGYSIPNKADNRYTLSFNAMPKVLSTGAYKFTISE